MACNNNSEQEFSIKMDVHHAVHVCNPDLKIDQHSTIFERWKRGRGSSQQVVTYCLLRYNVRNNWCWIIIITRESSVWIKTNIYLNSWNVYLRNYKSPKRGVTPFSLSWVITLILKRDHNSRVLLMYVTTSNSYLSIVFLNSLDFFQNIRSKV